MTTIMTVRAPEELKKILHDEAFRQGTTRNALVLQILWDWADKRPEKVG